MEEMYLNVIKNVTDDEDAHYLFNPVHIDSKNYIIESVKTPNNPLLNEEWMKDNPLIKQIMFILPLVRDFKGRKVKDMKISVNDEEFLVYSIDYSLLDFGCYGVTIIRALNESMPVNKELELSENSYKMITHVLNGETDLENSLKNLVLDYKNNCSLNSAFNRARHEKGNNNYSLEKIVSDKKVIPKWDFFIAQNGLPLTDIFRYHPKKDLFDAHPDDFFRLNMNRKYDLEAFSSSTLDFIHSLNCAALASSYLVCKGFGSFIDKNTRLKQITTELHKGLGFGFTFLQPIIIQNQEAILCLDVKNKFDYNGKYERILTGKEIKALDLAGKMLEKEQEDFTKNGEINQDKIFGKLAQVVKNVHK